MRKFLKYAKWPMLIIIGLPVAFLALNGMLLLAFNHETLFVLCFSFVSVGVLLNFMNLIGSPVFENPMDIDKRGDAIRLTVSVLLLLYLFFGTSIFGKYTIVQTDDATWIKHEIFPYSPKEMLQCKEAEELKFDLSLIYRGHQFFLVKGTDGKNYVYHAYPITHKLDPLVSEADSLIFEDDHTVKAFMGDSTATVDILKFTKDSDNNDYYFDIWAL